MNATFICKTLQERGHEAYIIGGAVRDKLMGITPKDEDVVTNARPEEIMNDLVK